MAIVLLDLDLWSMTWDLYCRSLADMCIYNLVCKTRELQKMRESVCHRASIPSLWPWPLTSDLYMTSIWPLLQEPCRHVYIQLGVWHPGASEDATTLSPTEHLSHHALWGHLPATSSRSRVADLYMAHGESLSVCLSPPSLSLSLALPLSLNQSSNQ